MLSFCPPITDQRPVFQDENVGIFFPLSKALFYTYCHISSVNPFKERLKLNRLFLRILLVPLFILSWDASAKRFRNAYISFELPTNWDCKLEGAEWVCESTYTKKIREAIIILTAKEVGPADTLASYQAHLQTPRMVPAKDGTPQKSQVLHVKQRLIANHLWVDGMHLGSEVGPYFTRYLATVKERIAILVTFSAHKEHYTKYSQDFLKAIDSLRVVASKDLLSRKDGIGSVRGSNETIGAPIGNHIPLLGDASGLPEENSGGNSTVMNLLLLALLAGAVGGFIFIKMRKKNSPVKKKSKK